MAENVLELKNLRVKYELEEDTVEAVNGVNIQLKQGETLGLVGETGAGKTTTALSLLRSIPLGELWNAIKWRSAGKMFLG